MELRRYFLVLRRWLWLVLLATAIGGASAYLFSARQTKLYRATATLIVNQNQSATGITSADVQASQQLASTYDSIAISWPVLQAAGKRLGLGDDSVAIGCPCLLRGGATILTFGAETPVGSQLINVSAVSPSPQTAARGANAVANSLAETVTQSQLGDAGSVEQNVKGQIQALQAAIQKTFSDIQSLQAQSQTAGAGQSAAVTALQGQLAQEQSAYSALVTQDEQLILAQARAANVVKLIAPARPPATYFTPRTRLNAGLGSLAGLMLAVTLALVLEYLDDRVQTPVDVERATSGAPTLGIVERLTPGADSGLTERLVLHPGVSVGRALEAYRLLRSNLEYTFADQPARTFAITSARPGEGKTTTAANIAIVLAQTGKRVLLVDADLRRPALHRLFGLPNTSGFSTLFLLGAPPPAAVSQGTQYEGLSVLTSGPLPPNPAELMSSARMRQIVARLAESAEYVVFDSPPLLAVADGGDIAARVDSVILVVDTMSTRPGQLASARGILARAGASLSGVVLNKLQRGKASADYYYNYYYSYSYRYGDARPAGQHGGGGRDDRPEQPPAVRVNGHQPPLGAERDD